MIHMPALAVGAMLLHLRVGGPPQRLAGLVVAALAAPLAAQEQQPLAAEGRLVGDGDCRGVGCAGCRAFRPAEPSAASKRKGQRSAEEAPRPTDGIVYFIQDVMTLAIKIGFCLKNPEKRLAALQTGNSNTLRLLGHVRGSVLHEKVLHMRFSRFHIQGEWFSNAIIADIKRILNSSSLEEWVKEQDPDLSWQSVPLGEAGSC
jgi:hypothetical protein